MQLEQQSIVVDTATERLLNYNLSSKYALTGRLSMSSIAYVLLGRIMGLARPSVRPSLPYGLLTREQKG